MTSTTPRAPEHLLRCGNADAGNPAAHSATFNAAPIDTDLREQESFVMRNSTIEAAMSVPNPSAPSSLADRDTPNTLANTCGSERSSWPFRPDDISPLQWWRTMPADYLGDAQHLLLRATMEEICLIEGREWLAGLHNDAATSIAIVLGALPITELSLEIDLTMSALMVSALSGNAGSVQVLSHILRLAPLDHPFARELSVSWLILNLRRAMEAKAEARASAIATLRATNNSCPIDHRAAFYAGDFS